MVNLKMKETNIIKPIKKTIGALCKHLSAVLSNKRWLQQITSRFVDWLVENIDEVNNYLRLSGDKVLTVPDEEARRRGKTATYNKLADRIERLEDIAEQYKQDRQDFIEHNEDEGIIEDIKRWLRDTYTNKDTLVIECYVGKYIDVVALEDILIWVQMCAEQSTSTKNQINSKVVTQAIMNSIDGMDI